MARFKRLDFKRIAAQMKADPRINAGMDKPEIAECTGVAYAGVEQYLKEIIQAGDFVHIRRNRSRGVPRKVYGVCIDTMQAEARTFNIEHVGRRILAHFKERDGKEYFKYSSAIGLLNKWFTQEELEAGIAKLESEGKIQLVGQGLYKFTPHQTIQVQYAMGKIGYKPRPAT